LLSVFLGVEVPIFSLLHSVHSEQWYERRVWPHVDDPPLDHVAVDALKYDPQHVPPQALGRPSPLCAQRLQGLGRVLDLGRLWFLQGDELGTELVPSPGVLRPAQITVDVDLAQAPESPLDVAPLGVQVLAFRPIFDELLQALAPVVRQGQPLDHGGDLGVQDALVDVQTRRLALGQQGLGGLAIVARALPAGPRGRAGHVERPAAVPALRDPVQQVDPAPGPAAGARGAPGPRPLHSVQQLRIEDRLVLAGEPLVPVADLAQVIARRRRRTAPTVQRPVLLASDGGKPSALSRRAMSLSE
jgi:hypothetical protein